MKYSVDPGKRDPLYLQLYYQIRDDIVTGAIPPGAKLPSKRTVAEETGVSVITAEHTYSLLADEGYVTAKEKSGFYVSTGDGVIPALSGAQAPGRREARVHTVNTEFPLSSFKRHMRYVISERGEELLERAPNNGCRDLREALSGYLGRFRGLEVSPDQIVIGAGAEYLYSLLIQLLGRERIYAIEDPCYPKIAAVYEANGITPEKLALCDDGIPTDVLSRSRADVLHITPYHSFPSGVTASASKRQQYIAWARKSGGFIIEDDYESEFSTLSKPVDTLWSLDPDGHVIYINTFSKTLTSSIRTGYMVIPRPLLDAFNTRLGFYSCTVPVFDQLVLASFIDSGEFERHINKVRRRLRRDGGK